MDDLRRRLEGVMKKPWPALALVVVLAACSSTMGRQIDPADLTTFKSGVSKITDVEAKLGAPTSQSTDAQGVTTLSYVYQHTQQNGFLGSSAVQQQEIDFNFDRGGTLTNFTQSNYNNTGS